MATFDIQDTEFPGAMKMRTVEASNTSDGDSFTPKDAGMNRFIFVVVEVNDGTAALASYDESNQVINLWGDGDGTGTNAALPTYTGTATVRVTAFGK